MTIDKMIEDCKIMSQKGNIMFPQRPDLAEVHNKKYEQLAEWLEELKEYRKGFTEARNKDYETAYAKGFNDGCAKFSVGQDYNDGYKNGIDDFQEWLKTQVVGLDNTTKEILVVEYDTWVLAVDKFKEGVNNDD